MPGRLELLVVALTILAVVGVAWFVKGGHWRRGRLLFLGVALLGGLAVLARRLGWGELLVVLVLLGIPFFVLPARRAPEPGPRR